VIGCALASLIFSVFKREAFTSTCRFLPSRSLITPSGVRVARANVSTPSSRRHCLIVDLPRPALELTPRFAFERQQPVFRKTRSHAQCLVELRPWHVDCRQILRACLPQKLPGCSRLAWRPPCRCSHAVAPWRAPFSASLISCLFQLCQSGGKKEKKISFIGSTVKELEETFNIAIPRCCAPLLPIFGRASHVLVEPDAR